MPVQARDRGGYGKMEILLREQGGWFAGARLVDQVATTPHHLLGWLQDGQDLPGQTKAQILVSNSWFLARGGLWVGAVDELKSSGLYHRERDPDVAPRMALAKKNLAQHGVAGARKKQASGLDFLLPMLLLDLELPGTVTRSPGMPFGVGATCVCGVEWGVCGCSVSHGFLPTWTVVGWRECCLPTCLPTWVGG